MKYRIESDSLGEVKVPENALYGAQTQRAVENFQVSGLALQDQFIRALAVIKKNAALVNAELGFQPGSRLTVACQLLDTGMHPQEYRFDLIGNQAFLTMSETTLNGGVGHDPTRKGFN